VSGHRRTTAPRQPDGTVHPTAHSRRVPNRRQRMLAEYAAAQTEQERVGVLYRNVCATATALRKRDPDEADRLLRAVVDDLHRATDALCRALDDTKPAQHRRPRGSEAAATVPVAAPPAAAPEPDSEVASSWNIGGQTFTFLRPRGTQR
jgi:hypothetical protein